MNIYKNPYVIFLFLSVIGMPVFSAVSPEQEMMLKQLPPDQRAAIEGKMLKSDDLTEDIDAAINSDSFLVEGLMSKYTDNYLEQTDSLINDMILSSENDFNNTSSIKMN